MKNTIDMDELFVKPSNIETFSDDEMIIGYSQNDSTTFCFNEISHLIYSLCDTKTPNQIVEHIMKMCKLNKDDFEMVKNDVNDVLIQFLQHHIIEKRNDK